MISYMDKNRIIMRIVRVFLTKMVGDIVFCTKR